MRWMISCALLLAACSSSSSAVADAAVDGPANVCLICRADQVCVASYDGLCSGAVACRPRTVGCPGNACSADCQAAYCPALYQCTTRSPCGTEPPQAFTCYGP